MDTNALHSCLEATLQADANVRMQAELDLKKAEKAPGFINSCLDIVVEPRVSDPVKSAAAIYLKNKITKGWTPVTPSEVSIDEDEKPVFRERIIPALVKSVPSSRQVLVKVLNIIVARDFPKKWPNLVNITLELFQSHDVETIRVGLTCLLEICKYYRWTHEQQQEFDAVIEATFDGVLTIGNSLINENSTAAGDMLRHVLKIYKCAIQQVLPERLQTPDNLANWGNLMLSVIRKELPEDVLKLNEEDREFNPWVKCKKWAFANLYRLFYKYAADNKIGKRKSYTEFSKTFIANYVPEILKAYFEQIELWVEKKIWLGSASLYNILAFLEECVKYKETWELLKPHSEIIVAHVVFPLLCTTDHDIEIFETDPSEYIHKRIDVYEEDPTPDTAAINFLTTLVRKRSRHSLSSLLAFVQGVVTAHLANTEDLDLARQQEAALRIMASISHLVLSKKSPIADKMETFIAQYVFPDFTSPHGFLRARACNLSNHYAEVKFENIENISIAYQSILRCLEDEHLPVQVEAALALQPMVTHENVHASLSENIPEVMTCLLDLTSKVDIDSISGVIGEFVEVFSEQLTPFAVDLASRMRDQLIRLLGELVEQQNLDFDSAGYDEVANEDKTMSVLGLLNTMSTLLLALDNASNVVIQLENILKPVIEIIFQQRLSEFYADVFGLIENCTYCLKTISPTMWVLFVQMHGVFKEDALDYLSEIFPSIDNYLQYGAEEIGNNQQLKDILFDIFQTIMKETERLGSDDRAIACAIAQKMLLSLYGNIDEFVPQILETVSFHLTNDVEKLKNHRYLVSLLEVILASICYNPQDTLRFLEAKGLTQQFFTQWFEKMESFTRVYDLKLVILAMLGLFRVTDSDLPESIRNNLGQISKGMVSVLKKYPEAVKTKEEMEKEFNANGSYDGEDFYEDWDAGEGDEEEDGDDADVTATADYLEYLDAQSHNAGGSGGYFQNDELEEEPLTETVLDKMSPNVVVRDAFVTIRTSDPARYEVLTSGYTPEEAQIFEQCVAST